VASAILSIGVVVDMFEANQKQAAIQSCLIRLGMEIGNMDGQIGSKTRQALKELSISGSDDFDNILMQLENMLQQKFPGEFNAVRALEAV
jgi:hypothetical protein